MSDTDAETAPLLAFKQAKPDSRVRRYFAQPIRLDHAYLPLLVCCFITGLIDAGSYNAWSVFMGMQTGMFYMTGSNVYRRSPTDYPQAIQSSSP